MSLGLDQTELWRREYGHKGIPSSFREEPSGSLQDFMAFLRERGVDEGRVIDIGAGTGRNSIYLADQGYRVVSLELIPELAKWLDQKAAGHVAQGRITALRHDVTTPWPLEDASADLAIDTFCYKHQVTEAGKQTYRDELARALKPGAYFLLTLAGRDDGYYASLLAASPDPERHVIIDPVNGIPSILYTKTEIEQEFGDCFRLVHYLHKQRSSLMHGGTYDRSTHVFIFQRRQYRHKET